MDPRKYLVEFVGTFFLVLAVGMAVLGQGPPPGFAPVAIAGTLMVMIYAGGHISGAHYNPAVTLGIMLRGRCSASDAAPYVVAQLGAGAAAAMAVMQLKGAISPVAMSFQTAPTIIAELLFTFALVWVVLNVATAKATAGNSYFGLAIAGTVLAGALAVGGISGGVFNPAVALGLIVMGLVKIADVWMHLVGEVAGAILAAGVFKATVRE